MHKSVLAPKINGQKRQRQINRKFNLKITFGAMKKKRSFTVEQKMQILREADENGMLATCRKYEIAQSLYYRWKNQFNKMGIDSLQGLYYRVDPAVRELEKENERLKKIIARQALELEVKTELLKKTLQQKKRNM